MRRLSLLAALLSCAPLAGCGQANAGAMHPPGARTAFELGACRRCATVELIVSRPLQMRAGVAYDVTIRMDHGGRRVLTFDHLPAWQAGDKIRINGNALERA